jgi:hypothetical protein
LEVDGDFDQTIAFMDRLKVIKLATSLGGVTSLAVRLQTLWDKFGILLTDTFPENCRFNQFIP